MSKFMHVLYVCFLKTLSMFAIFEVITGICYIPGPIVRYTGCSLKQTHTVERKIFPHCRGTHTEYIFV